MNKYALFLQHRTKPGARSEVQKIWQRYMQPAIDGNPGHETYVYSFGSDPDRICAFQVYSGPEEASAFLRSSAYVDYEREVSPLLEGPPQVEVLHPQWIKGVS